jgi:formate/nitrite transporter FocA (FNT family)
MANTSASSTKTRPRDEAGETKRQDDASRHSPGITQQEADDVEERAGPRTPVIYEVVRRIGDDEMARPIVSLWWSGVAAGISMSFSLLAEAILQTHLPDEPWRLLLTSLGYSVGFLMVVLARQQLFTENTITAVLPVVADFTPGNLWKLSRMWGIVLAANMAGTLVASIFCSYAPLLSPELKDGMLELSQQLLGHDWFEMLFRGVGAGFLIAAMVWLIPGAETAQFHVIILITSLISAAGFMHIVAGSVEAFMLILHGDAGWWPMIASFFIPVLIGNVLGGTALFALLSYAQVMSEI